MTLDEQLKEMQKFVERSLQATGQFTAVNPGWKYGDQALDKLRKRNIRAVKDAEYTATGRPEEYLIVCDVDVLSREDFAAKLVAASQQGIYTVHITTRSTDDERGFFRRDKLADTVGQGKEQAGYQKKTLQHLPKVVRENIRKLRALELWLDELGYGRANYYQHPTARLEEGIRKYDFEDVEARGVRLGEEYRNDLVFMKYPVEVEHLSEMTLVPMVRKALPEGIAFPPYIGWAQSNRIGSLNNTFGKNLIPPMTLLVGEIIHPGIDAATYHDVQFMQTRERRGLDPSRGADQEERLCIQIYDGGFSREQVVLLNTVFPTMNFPLAELPMAAGHTVARPRIEQGDLFER